MSVILAPNGLAPKKTEPLTERELQWLAIGEDVCRKLNLGVVCLRCLRSGIREAAMLRGNNDPNDPVLSVTCDCRRMTFRQKAD